MARVVVVGAGMSGLCLAWYLRRLKPEWDLVVLEAEDRVGGKAYTVEEEGYLVERGVNGVLDNKPATLALASEIGVPALKSLDASRRRFIVKDADLKELPDSPKAFFKSDILSATAKARLMAEPFIPRCTEPDESLASFARRRLGREAYRYLIDPMASGIFAGDPERLSVRSAFPRVWELEQEFGSLIRAMFALKRRARRQGGSGPASAGPGGVLTSFRRGMGELVQALSGALGEHIRCSSPVEAIEPGRDGWRVAVEGGKVIEATHLVLACPARQASRLLKEVAPEASEAAGAIPYPPIAVVAFGVRAAQVKRDMNGFGFLCPHSEGRRILGCLWDSSVFSHRAPEGRHLLRCLMGGARMPEMARLPDRQLVDTALEELRGLVGLTGEPEYLHVFRWQEAIPQYNVGHWRLMEQVKRSLSGRARLYVRCNWIGGVALNDCVANSKALAEEMAGGRPE